MKVESELNSSIFEAFTSQFVDAAGDMGKGGWDSVTITYDGLTAFLQLNFRL